MPISRPVLVPVVLSAGAAAGHSPADSTTYNFANQPATNPGTSDSAFSIIMPRAGVVRAASGIFVVGGTLASGESITVRAKNNTGPTTQDITTALVGTAIGNAFNNGALSLAFAAHDALQVQFVTPAWVTNPTATFWTVTFLVEYF